MDATQLFCVLCDTKEFSDVQFEDALSLLDEPSRQRARKFYQRDDAWRFILGRCLREAILSRFLPRPLIFKETAQGKPYLYAPSSTPYVGFNISHDSFAILLGVRRNGNESVAKDIGVDIMRIHVPEGQSFSSFLGSLEPAFTDSEVEYLRAQGKRNEAHAIRSLFQVWTIKEAYSKALGIGLGLDPRWIEYRFKDSILARDGQPLGSEWVVRTVHGYWESRRNGYEEYIGAVCYRSNLEEGGRVAGFSGEMEHVEANALLGTMKTIMSQ